MANHTNIKAGLERGWSTHCLCARSREDTTSAEIGAFRRDCPFFFYQIILGTMNSFTIAIKLKDAKSFFFKIENPAESKAVAARII